MNWDDIKVITKFGGNYYSKIKNNPKFFGNFQSRLFKQVVDIEEIVNKPSKYFLKISPWHIEKVLSTLADKKATIIYSQWLGYLESEYSDNNTVELYQRLKSNNQWVYAHTSGHADLNALQQFASAIKAKTLIPIHTELKNEFVEHFEYVVVLDDGEVFEI